MKIRLKQSFHKDIKKIKEKSLKESLATVIESVESASSMQEIPNLRKLKGYKDYYRIRLSDYRIGIQIKDDTVFFVVFGHRKDIYRNFPK